MGASSKSFIVAADLFVACALITFAISGTKVASRAQQIASENLNKDTVQYMESDISMILSNLHSGAQVKKYVEKYRHKMSVEVQTLKSSYYTTQPIRFDASTSTMELTDSNSNYYVKNNDVFKCEGDRDSNGVFINLRFIQEGAYTPEGSDNVNTPSEAFTDLANTLGMPATSSWADICSKVKVMNTEEQEAKHNLVTALINVNQDLVIEDSSPWNVVTSTTADVLNAYRDVTQNMASTHHKSSKILSYMQSWEIGFEPEIIIISKSSGASVNTYCWTSGKWVTDEPNVTISGKTITHTDALNAGDTIEVTAYN